MQHRNEGVYALRDAADMHAREEQAMRRKLRMLRWLLLGAVIFLTGCGGSGGDPTPIVPVVLHTLRPDVLFCYFGLVSEQVREIAAHVNAVHLPDWGDWDTAGADIEARIVAQLHEAQANGISRAIVCTGFLTFTTNHQYRGTAALMAFRQRLDAAGLLPMVIGLYPLDEPDVSGLSDALVTQAVNETRAAWPGPKIGVIYGTHGTPGIGAYDWVGMDDYGAGAGVLQRLPSIRADQRWIVVPGGADPWKQDPAPFVDFANSHPQVAVFMPFCWFDGYGGTPNAGIRSNGMALRYAAASAKGATA